MLSRASGIQVSHAQNMLATAIEKTSITHNNLPRTRRDATSGIPRMCGELCRRTHSLYNVKTEAKFAAINEANALVRRFAAMSNLLIAGRSFSIIGSGDLPDSVAEFLSRLGALSAPIEDADYVFVFSASDAASHSTHLAAPQSTRLAELPVRAGALVIDCGAEGPAIEIPAITERARLPFVTATLPPLAVGASPRRVHTARLTKSATSASAPADAAGPTDTAAPTDTAVRADASALTDAALRLAWARDFMPASRGIAEQLAASGSVRGTRIGISMVLEPKTAVLALLLRDAGAEVVLYAHADETDDAIAHELTQQGFAVFAESTADFDRQRDLALAFLGERLELILDDGSHLIRLAHLDGRAALGTLRAAAEETTSGLRPLITMHEQGALTIPVIAVNDSEAKTGFDNRYGTGQSCVFAIADLSEQLYAATGMQRNGGSATSPLAGAHVVVIGFGPVGVGVAEHAAACGAEITVAETNPLRALQARFAGFAVTPVHEAVATADFVISATGMQNTIPVSVMRASKTDAILAVAGGVLDEIAVDQAVREGASITELTPKAERLTFASGSSVIVLDRGGCINITAAEGNPVQIMDLSFAVQLAAVAALMDSRFAEPAGLVPLPGSVDVAVATSALAAAGVRYDDAAQSSAEQPDEAADASWLPTRFYDSFRTESSDPQREHPHD